MGLEWADGYCLLGYIFCCIILVGGLNCFSITMYRQVENSSCFVCEAKQIIMKNLFILVNGM